MIKNLTKKQEEQIPKYIEKFVSYASKKTDRKKATKAVQDLYKSAKKDKPIVIFGKSPFQTAIMVVMCKILFKNKIIKKDSRLGSQLYSQLSSQLDSQLFSQLNSQLDSQFYSQLDSQLGSQLGSQLDSQLYSQLNSQLYSQLDSQLDSQLYSQLYSQLGSQLDSQLGSQLDSQLYSQLRSQLGPQLSSQLRSQLGSQLHSINNDWWLTIYWLIWAGWYSFSKYIGVKFDDNVYNLFMNFVTNVSFLIPYKGICFVSENPKEINWENGQLHSDKKPAIEYEDGYSLYSLKGIRFKKEWWEKIVNDKMTPEEILAIDNTEHRRIAWEYMNKNKLEGLKDFKVLDECLDEKGNRMRIVQFKHPDAGKIRYYNCLCPSTDREYYLGTEEKTCKKAKAKSFGFDANKIEFVNEW